MTTLNPLEEFICDSCGGIIEKKEDGYVVWDLIENSSQKGKKESLQGNFRIQHRECQQILDYSSSLTEFMGIEGTRQFLDFLDEGEIFKHGLASEISSIRELVVLHRRTHLPYYDQARHYFEKAKKDIEYWEDMDSDNLYSEDILRQIIEKYGV